MATFDDRFQGDPWPMPGTIGTDPWSMESAMVDRTQLDQELHRAARQMRPQVGLEALIRALLGLK